MKIHAGLERRSERPLTLAIGFFDGMHRGHREIARRARLHREPGWRSGVLTFANHPTGFLRPGNEPPLLATPEERIDAFANAGYEECFFVRFDERIASLSPDAFLNLLRTLHTRVIITGAGFRFGHQRSGDAQSIATYCAAHEMSFDAVAPVTDDAGERISSTRIRGLIGQGKIDEADTLLGGWYELRGVVESGFGRGHDLGFPTANLRVGQKLLPKDGVYAAVARHDGRDYPALVSIGMNPQFAGEKRSIEVWMRDFYATIYGHELALRDLRFLREQRTFANLDALMEQMREDERAVAYPAYG